MFVFLLIFPHLDAAQILLYNPELGATSLSKLNQSKISLTLLFHPPEPNSDISSGTCKGNCPCGKMSKPLIVVLLLSLPRDTTTLCVSHIYLGVQIFPLLYCVSSLEQLTVENVSVLRKGEYHNKNAATVDLNLRRFHQKYAHSTDINLNNMSSFLFHFLLISLIHILDCFSLSACLKKKKKTFWHQFSVYE